MLGSQVQMLSQDVLTKDPEGWERIESKIDGEPIDVWVRDVGHGLEISLINQDDYDFGDSAEPPKKVE